MSTNNCIHQYSITVVHGPVAASVDELQSSYLQEGLTYYLQLVSTSCSHHRCWKKTTSKNTDYSISEQEHMTVNFEELIKCRTFDSKVFVISC